MTKASTRVAYNQLHYGWGGVCVCVCVCLLICFPGVFEGEQSRSSMEIALIHQKNNIGGLELDGCQIVDPTEGLVMNLASFVFLNVILWNKNIKTHQPFEFLLVLFAGSREGKKSSLHGESNFSSDIFKWVSSRRGRVFFFSCMKYCQMKRDLLPDLLLSFRPARWKSAAWQLSAFISLSGPLWCFAGSDQRKDMSLYQELQLPKTIFSTQMNGVWTKSSWQI